MAYLIWGRSAPDQFTSRCNRYTITHEGRARWVLRDGWGRELRTARNLEMAQGYAQAFADGILTPPPPPGRQS